MNTSIKDIDDLAKIYESIVGSGPANINQTAMIKKAQDRIRWATDRVFLSDVFFSGHLTRLKKSYTFDLPTMATDGKNLKYNPKFVNTIPMEAVEVVLVHEIMHVAYAHHLAFADIDPKNTNLWKLVNIACDLSINHYLKDRTGFLNDALLAGRDEFKDFPIGKDAKFYYDLLLKKYQKPPEEDDEEDDEEGGEDGTEGGDGGTEGGEGGTEGGEGGTESGEGGTEGGEGGTEGVGQGGKTTKGTGKGKERGTTSGGSIPTTNEELDKTIEVPQDIIDRSQKTGQIEKPDDVNASNKDNKTEELKRENEQQLQTAEKIEKQRQDANVQSAGYGAGNSTFANPAYRDIIKEKNKPLPWSQILAPILNASEKERSHSVINKRFADPSWEKIFGGRLPGQKEYKRIHELIFLLDVSGSMPRETCYSIYRHIANVSKNESFGETSSIRLITFDDGIRSENMFTKQVKQNYKSVKGSNTIIPRDHIHKLPLNEDSFSKISWSGQGGGTYISSALDSIQNNIKPLPALVIILTDGWFTEEDKQKIANTNIKFARNIVWLMTTDMHYPIGKTYHLSKYAIPN